jgi:membrane-bound lytic murein transglycosylase D|tara:strand:+ start:4381 stop:5982 length:1602 start_codon:yes stop_codon:yes gene_type:complete
MVCIAKHAKIKSFSVAPMLALLIGCQAIVTETPREAAPEIQSSVAETRNEYVVSSPAISKSEVAATEEEISPETFENLWDRIRAGLQLQDLYSNDAIDHELGLYSTNQKYFDRIAERATPFLFWIAEQLENRNLPLELALVPIVESAYNPNVYSREHAVGMWQFVGATGRSFGLQQDWWYDGRRDPLASTLAALDFLEQLNKRFNNDWLLTLAAYNTGEGNIVRAIRRSGVSVEEADFWSLPLPRETLSHVPKILAIAKLLAKPELYEIELPVIPNRAYFERIAIDSQIDLGLAAKLAKIDEKLLRDLNPGYLQWATHPDDPQSILLPLESIPNFNSELASLPRDSRVTWDRYEILPGDTLGTIARKLGTSADILQRVNALPSSRIIAGRSLLIPRTNDPLLLASAPQFNRSNTLPAAVPNNYRVNRGDNLWSIARRFDMKSKDIAAWNKIDLQSILHPGQMLKLSSTTQIAISEKPPEDGQYQVVAGDSLAKIAGKFNLDLNNLLMWNNLNIAALIHPGQLIRINPTKPAVN